MKHYDIFIIGAGAAGIAAAKSAWNAGCRSIAIADRKATMGGILLQCAHRGFGQGQNGPEYTSGLLMDFPDDIIFYNNTTVLSVSADKAAVISGPATGLKKISFEQLILACGCREIPLGALPIAGTRPITHIPAEGSSNRLCGIFTAGQMQELMNLHSMIPQEPVAILGSGDLGLIMAAQLADTGVQLAGIIEQKEHCGGMLRNQGCLGKYSIPLFLERTITEICGYPELDGVMLSDSSYLPCRTLLIAVGLVPQQELLSEAFPESIYPGWVHLCGNARQVHSMVDGVILDGYRAGSNAAGRMKHI